MTAATRFREIYLENFSAREDQAEFNARKAVTPIPRFAGSDINDIRNAIYQRMRDITRRAGVRASDAVAGLNLGVDRRGSTMNAFIGVKVLTEFAGHGACGQLRRCPFRAGRRDVGGRGQRGTVPLPLRHRRHSFLDLLEARSARASSRRSCCVTR